MKKQPSQTGFIALISAIIIAVVLMLVISSTNLSGFYSRSNILDSELKERSGAIAEACVDEALLKLANDPSYPYPIPEIITVGSGSCDIISVSPVGTPVTWPKIIKTHAIYNNLHTNLEVKVNPDLSVVSWEEIP